MGLKDITVKSAKPREKAYKLFDGLGLYLEVMPNGAKYWRWKYRFRGKESRLAFGVYPDVSLGDARDKCYESRKLLKDGVDPGLNRKMTKGAGEGAEHTLEGVGREWLEKFSANWTPGYKADVQSRLERDVFPWFTGRLLKDIKAPELLDCLRRVEKRGALESAHRTKNNCSAIFRYGIATGRAEHDISADLRGALPPYKRTHHPSITDPEQVGVLLRAIEGYNGSLVTRSALNLAPLLFVRPGELRHAEWSEVNFDKAEWRIPAKKMKMREQHIVPLSRQALMILKELKPLTERSRYIFPSTRTADKPMSENTVNAALRALDYDKTEMTGHGFRSMASTLLNERGYKSDAIERQLAHGERDKVRGAYNFAEFLPERRTMMQEWADYLDELKRSK
jgi:integrase